MRLTIRQLKSIIRESLREAGYNKNMENGKVMVKHPRQGHSVSAAYVKANYPEAWARLEECFENDDMYTIDQVIFYIHGAEDPEVEGRLSCRINVPGPDGLWNMWLEDEGEWED